MGKLATTLIALAARKSAARFEKATRNPQTAQHQLLQSILQRNRDTEYGRQYDFGNIKSAGEYANGVPMVEYDDIRSQIDRMTLGEKNLLTSEDPLLFAQTSGTTGNPKYIPVTPTCQKGGGMTTWMHYARKDHPKMLSGKIVTIVSPAIEGWTEGKIPFGSTSGMVVKEMPKLVQSAYAAPYDVFEIKDYDAKYYTLLRFGLESSISFIGTANPSSILMIAEYANKHSEELIKDVRDGTLSSNMDIGSDIRPSLESRFSKNAPRARELERLVARRSGQLLPSDYWPDMALLGCWKGGTVSAYIQKLQGWYDPDQRGMVPVRDLGYLASEARMSIPVSDTGSGGVLTVHLNYFEFVSAEEMDERPDTPDKWTFLTTGELDVGREYYVFITTTGGLYRYDINDVIEVVGKYNETPVIVFLRKGRGMSNLTGEKLSVNQIIDAIGRAQESTSTQVGHFRAEPDVDSSRYILKIEFEDAPTGDQYGAFLAATDDALSEVNIEYAAKRASGRLKSPVLQVMKAGWYERGKEKLVSEGKRLFQAKTVLLDAKQGYHPEPEDLEYEIYLNP